jgi:hypothetical protein
MATPTNLPAAFVAGAVLTADQMNNIRGAFRVLQVVNANHSIQVSTSSNAFTDTGLTASITPTSTTSKILVMVSQAGCLKDTSNTFLELRLLRDATTIVTFEKYGGFTLSNASNSIGACTTTYLDSPATISSITYKTQMASNANTAAVYTQTNGGTSTITLMEISA